MANTARTFTFFAILGLLAPLCVPFGAQAQEQVIAAIGKPKSTKVRLFTADGVETSSFSISNAAGDELISGDWDGTGNAPAVLNVKNQKVSLQLRSRSGDQLATLKLATPLKNIHSIFVADLDNSGVADVAVVSLKGASLIYLDPAISPGQISINLPTADTYHAAMQGGVTVGIASLRHNSRDLTVVDLSGAQIINTKLTVPNAGKLIPVSLSSGDLVVGLVEEESIEIFNQSGQRISKFSKAKAASALSGNFTYSAADHPHIMRAEPTGILSLLEPATGYVTASSYQVANDEDDPCAATEDKVNQLLIQISALIQAGKYKQAEILSKKLGKSKLNPYCFGLPGLPSSSSSSSSADTTKFATSQVQVEGGAALACDSFRNAKDGAKSGFVMKDGDYTGKSVVLLPGGTPPYQSVQILNNKFKQIENLRNSGLGNPDSNFMLRQHWRGKAPMVRYPSKFYVRGVLGGTKHCWVVNRGKSTRVD